MRGEMALGVQGVFFFLTGMSWGWWGMTWGDRVAWEYLYLVYYGCNRSLTSFLHGRIARRRILVWEVRQIGIARLATQI
jgi:hypothetical protein